MKKAVITKKTETVEISGLLGRTSVLSHEVLGAKLITINMVLRIVLLAADLLRGYPWGKALKLFHTFLNKH